MGFLKALEGIRTPVMNWIFQGITYLGEQVAIMILIMIIYWCFNRRRGIFLMYVVVAGAAVNNLLKGIFCIARPWVQDPEFTIVESARDGASGYSFPSGHMQAAGSCYFGLARTSERRWARIAEIALALLIGFSRMYLGVHTPLDVWVSILITAVLVFGVGAVYDREKEDRQGKWMLPLFLFLAAVCAGQIIHQTFLPQSPAADPVNSADALATAYKLSGLSVGMMFGVWLEETRVCFSTDAPLRVQIIKVAVGLAGLLVFQVGLKAPLNLLMNGHPAAHLIRYGLLAFWGTGLWPMLFVHLPGAGQTGTASAQASQQQI